MCLILLYRLSIIYINLKYLLKRIICSSRVALKVCPYCGSDSPYVYDCYLCSEYRKDKYGNIDSTMEVSDAHLQVLKTEYKRIIKSIRDINIKDIRRYYRLNPAKHKQHKYY